MFKEPAAADRSEVVIPICISQNVNRFWMHLYRLKSSKIRMMNLKLSHFSHQIGKFKKSDESKTCEGKASFWQKEFNFQTLMNPLFCSLWILHV